MPSDTIDKVKNNHRWCEARKKYTEIDIYHVCKLKSNHKDNHICAHCNLEWENEINLSRRNEEAK